MELGLQGKSVLVLASSKGLGKATALQFAQEGANVMITSRSEEGLKQAAEEIREATGSEVATFACDLTRPNDIKALIAEIVSRFGTVDVLVNNTGGPPGGTFDDFDDEEWQHAFELTLLSYVRTIREVLPLMRKQQSGKIINITSTSIKQPIDNLILSNTFRNGVNGLAKTLATELAKDNILINTVGPGRFDTDRVQEIDEATSVKLGNTVAEIREKASKAIPLGRYGNPGELAKLVVFLASDANTYLTGQSILIDGGQTKGL
ncbi:SDR family oxidoreductase [Sporosarcina sp. 179-K 3D1 HS]|uniref:SDR family oxidoreductase n=1 Tax=Sporosarcina sp. 179-K 3D1 HS TaxID=3232169 RepID=UPI0039A3CBC6